MFLSLPDAASSANPAILSIAIPSFLPLWTSWDLQKGRRLCSSDPHLSVPTATSNVCADEVSEKDWCIGSLIERPGITGKRLTDILGLRMKTDPNQRTQDLKFSSALTPQMWLLPYPTPIQSTKAFLLAHRPICGQGCESDERFSRARYIHIMRAVFPHMGACLLSRVTSMKLVLAFGELKQHSQTLCSFRHAQQVPLTNLGVWKKQRH